MIETRKMNKVNKIMSVLLFSSFALPPKWLDRSWVESERERLFSKIDTFRPGEDWSYSWISTDANPHGSLVVDQSRAELLSLAFDGKSYTVYSLRNGITQKRNLKGQLHQSASKFFKEMSTQQITHKGKWSYSNSELYFIPQRGDGRSLWNIPIPSTLIGFDSDRDRSSVLGLSAYPNVLYHLFWKPRVSRSEALIEKLLWDNDSELVAWETCAEGKSILVENHSEELRIHFLSENSKFRTMEWGGYLSLNADQVKSLGGDEVEVGSERLWATGFALRSCHDFFVSTVEGVFRAQK